MRGRKHAVDRRRFEERVLTTPERSATGKSRAHYWPLLFQYLDASLGLPYGGSLWWPPRLPCWWCRRGFSARTHVEHPSLAARLAEAPVGCKSLQGIAAGLGRRARLERVRGAALLILQMSENPVDE